MIISYRLRESRMPDLGARALHIPRRSCGGATCRLLTGSPLVGAVGAMFCAIAIFAGLALWDVQGTSEHGSTSFQLLIKKRDKLKAAEKLEVKERLRRGCRHWSSEEGI